MADGLNKVYCMGNLGQEVELKFSQSGTAVLNLSVGCNGSYLDKNRVRQETVEWVRIVIFGRRAEALAKFLKKGDRVFCEGSLRTNSYEDREGNKRYSTNVVAHNIILGGSNNPRSKPKDPEYRRPSRRDDDDDQRPADRSAPSGGGGGGYDDSDYGSGGGFGDGDDEIPFVRVTRPDQEHWWRF